MTRRELLLMAAGLSATAVASASLRPVAAGSLLERFHATYRSLRTVRCTFTSSAGIRGTLAAQRGGSYRVEMPDRTIVSDAASVWSATTSARTVIINRYRATSNELSLEKVFFDIMSVYRGSVIQEEKRGGGTLRLEPPAQNAIIAGVTRADITLDRSMKVTSVTLTVNRSTQTFRVSDLVLDPKLGSTTFRFDVPKGWETIDLR